MPARTVPRYALPNLRRRISTRVRITTSASVNTPATISLPHCTECPTGVPDAVRTAMAVAESPDLSAPALSAMLKAQAAERQRKAA